MRQIFALLFLIAASNSSIAAEACPATERDLTGYWTRNSQIGDFEEFLLEESGGTRTFNSWLHQTPELSGARWKIENCQLVITSRLGEYPETRLKILGLRKGKLRLYRELDREESIYLRTRNES